MSGFALAKEGLTLGESDRVSPFSIVTPTYNRASELSRAYASLLEQTLLPAEWIIVDDGSTDETHRVVAGWIEARPPFTIRYIHQANAGKPTASNVGVAAATAELVAVLDNDDWLVPQALERLHSIWESIPADRRSGYTGVSVNCQFESGSIVGREFPSSPIDSTLLELRVRGWLEGDKWGFHRRDVIQRFPYPIFPGEKYVPDALVWNRIGRKFKMRFVNETLVYKRYLRDGVTKKWIEFCAASATGTRLYYLEVADMTPKGLDRLRALSNAVRYGAHAGDAKIPHDLLVRFPVLARCARIIGWAAWTKDRWHLSKRAGA